MPDNNDKYNGGGFTQGSDGAVYGDSGSDPGSTSDYDTWDWKQIQAAIVGMSAGVHSQANEDHAAAVASPQSLQDAADILAEVQGVLDTVAQSLTAQAKALAGDNGPWQGAAADAFAEMIDGFSKQVQANVEALAGGSTGAHNVPQQVADNAVNLANAQRLIGEIDLWYANQARQMGVQPMSNGLIPISKKPQLVEMMTNDMRKVLKSLAGNYRVTIDSIKSPSPITSPGNTSPTDGLPDTSVPDSLTNPDTGTGLDPATGTGLDTGTGTGLAPDLATDAATGPGDGTATPFSGSLDPGGTADGDRPSVPSGPA
ncbi:WXG100 family type VII secretion target, partial [Streptomyces hyaluromycini]